MGEFSERRVLVFDVGGSHASAALASGGTLTGTCSVPVNSSGRAEEILGSFEQLGRQVLRKCEVSVESLAGISLGFPNPFDYEVGVSYLRHKYDQLYGRNLGIDLAAKFGIQKDAITFVNDACAFLLGEMRCGAAVGVERVVGITLGTGVGSAFAVGGRIVTLDEGVPNEGYLWNIPYQSGIVEDFISTRAIRRLFRDVSGEDVEVREIAHRAATDVDARIAMNQFGATLGEVIGAVCRRFRPDAVVLGGAISRSAQLFLPAAQAELGDTSTRLLVSRLFDDAALLGAYVAWDKRIGAAKCDHRGDIAASVSVRR